MQFRDVFISIHIDVEFPTCSEVHLLYIQICYLKTKHSTYMPSVLQRSKKPVSCGFVSLNTHCIEKVPQKIVDLNFYVLYKMPTLPVFT